MEESARFSTSYINYRAVDYITQNNQISPNIMWVHNWPGFSVLSSYLTQFTSIPVTFILLFYPLFFNILLSIALFLFFRVDLTSKIAWIAVWFVLLGNWVNQDYFSMQSLAFFMLVLVLFLTSKNVVRQVPLRQSGIVLLVFITFIISSHLLTSLAILCIFLVLYLSKSLNRPILVFSIISLIATWQIFNANIYISSGFMGNFRDFLDFFTIFQSNVSNRIVAGSSAHMFVSQVSVLYSAIIFIFGLLSILLLWRSKQILNTDKKVLSIFVSFLLLGVLFAYGGELFMRLFLFILLPLAFFSAKAMLKYKILFIIGVLFFASLAPVMLTLSHYGNEQMDYVPPSETVGSSFLFSYTTHGEIAGYFRYFNYENRDYSISYLRQAFPMNLSNYFNLATFRTSQDRFLCMTYFEKVHTEYFFGDTTFIQEVNGNLTQSPFFNLIYSNPSFSIYQSEND